LDLPVKEEAEAEIVIAATDEILKNMLTQTAAMHKHLCPRQVLGVRMGIVAAGLFPFELPQKNKRLLAFVEADGCFADGVSAATGCTLGHRTMRLVDYGKVAVTFADTETGRAVRLSPLAGVRKLAAEAAPEEANRWKAQLAAYQTMPAEQMFRVQEVRLNLDLAAVVGAPRPRMACAECGEEILNQRAVEADGRTLCVSCVGESYWSAVE
jgi:formylmethanofuran dehydrogenase subunit E